ncbi:hypothetical protein SLEP1_g36554 [Rubroshorea leprosula]|uniref:Uncharacterized protein n=1 Tax=Rubroshorea leprosula TaxID=152421 RepID=A0AAV5KSA1_9ROSI|nr:hypothetical protein SLEP1_g36554 [Rubroshorea leprosula]
MENAYFFEFYEGKGLGLKSSSEGVLPKGKCIGHLLWMGKTSDSQPQTPSLHPDALFAFTSITVIPLRRTSVTHSLLLAFTRRASHLHLLSIPRPLLLSSEVYRTKETIQREESAVETKNKKEGKESSRGHNHERNIRLNRSYLLEPESRNTEEGCEEAAQKTEKENLQIKKRCSTTRSYGKLSGTNTVVTWPKSILGFSVGILIM